MCRALNHGQWSILKVIYVGTMIFAQLRLKMVPWRNVVILEEISTLILMTWIKSLTKKAFSMVLLDLIMLVKGCELSCKFLLLKDGLT